MNGDQTRFHSCMSGETYSGEFVIRYCLLGGFIFHPYLHIEHVFLYIIAYKHGYVKGVKKVRSALHHIISNHLKRKRR